MTTQVMAIQVRGVAIQMIAPRKKKIALFLFCLLDVMLLWFCALKEDILPVSNPSQWG